MPHIVVHVSGQPDPEQTRRIIHCVTKSTVEILGKRPEVVAIALIHIARDQWFVGGESLAELGRNAFHLDITITDETNLKSEKARYLAAIFAQMSEVLGDVHDCSYIHVIDTRAAAYGYGGLTQEHRYQHP